MLLAAHALGALHGCATRPAHEGLNAVLWTQTSAEYAANTLQAYRQAVANLDPALADTQWTAAVEQGGNPAGLPPAVMLDLDQTVLDTSPYNARIILEYGSHSAQRFAEWCRNTTAPAVPGVKAFVDHAVARGITVFYVSARAEALRECTSRNLRALGLPLPGQENLLLNDGTAATSKTRQRAGVATQYRLLLLLGDNLDDFIDGSKSDPETRRALVGQHADRWGKEWIVLPNPMYGYWEAALYGFDFRLPRDQRLDRLLRQLQR
jgi:acid phosphatase